MIYQIGRLFECSVESLFPSELGLSFLVYTLNARGLLCVSVCVYPSVPALAASASVGTSKQRYSRVSLRLFLDHMCEVSKKPSVQKIWRGKANMQMSWSSPSAAFAQFRDQRNAVAT